MSEKIVTAEVVRCSDSLNKKMAMWRADLCDLPREFIDFHADLAWKELQRIISVYGVSKASEPRLVNEEWGDGMKVIEVSVDTLKGKRVKLKWYPGAVQQGFFKCSEECGGSALLFERDLLLQKEKTMTKIIVCDELGPTAEFQNDLRNNALEEARKFLVDIFDRDDYDSFIEKIETSKKLQRVKMNGNFHEVDVFGNGIVYVEISESLNYTSEDPLSQNLRSKKKRAAQAQMSCHFSSCAS